HIKEPALLFDIFFRFGVLVRAYAFYTVYDEYIFPLQAFGAMHSGKHHTVLLILSLFKLQIVSDYVPSPVGPVVMVSGILLVFIPDPLKVLHILIPEIRIFLKIFLVSAGFFHHSKEF